MKTVNGMYFPEVDTHMSAEYSEGKFQFDAIDRALTYVKNFGVAVDGGAFIGMISKHLSKRFSEVISFEPAKDTFECLQKNTKEHPNIIPMNSGLSDKMGFCSLDQDQRWDGNTGGRYIVPGNDFTLVRLDQCTLDPVGFIKLDVEGHELFALKGAQAIIQRDSPVILCEEKPRLMERQGLDKNCVREYLEGLGYKQVDRIRRDFIYTRS